MLKGKSSLAEEALSGMDNGIIVEESEKSSSDEDPTTTNNSDKRSTTSEDTFVHQETKQVNRSKLFVYLALILAAAAVGVLTYMFTSREETNDFHVEVSSAAAVVPRRQPLRAPSHLALPSDSSVDSLERSSMLPSRTPRTSLARFTPSAPPSLPSPCPATKPGQT